MEGEVYNLLVDWSIALACLLYCRVIGSFIAQGTPRFLAVFPVICIFICLPLNLYTMHLCGLTFFFISWLGTFKLILYAFGQGPLSSSHPPADLSLSHFIFTACLPIKIIRKQSHGRLAKKSLKDYAPRVVLFTVTISALSCKDYLHELLTTTLYAYYLFFVLELILAMTTYLARTIAGFELEPTFDEPHHATSVQNFWGKRWNLMVTSILRPTVYHPARTIFSHLVSKRWVSVPAVFATFLVSGLMHELIFYYLGRLTPTWEVTWFFIVQGVWVGIEIVMKKSMAQQLKPPPTTVARMLTLSFVMLTSFCLFFPPFLRLDPLAKSCTETMALVGFFKSGQLLSPNDYACPFM